MQNWKNKVKKKKGSLWSIFSVLYRLDLGLTSHPNDAFLYSVILLSL